MINLLPPQTKQDMFYGRRNIILRHWVFAFLVALAGACLIIGTGYLYLQRSIDNQTKLIEESKQRLVDQKVDETQKRLGEISANTKLVVQVLSREVLFSKLLRQIGASLPANTSLQELQIDKLQGGITLKALAKNTDAATQIQLNLADPKNGVFEKADLESINCTPPDPEVKYPCSVQVRALFSKNNTYTYITPSTGGGTNK